jgi:hypothetical protein
MSYNQLEQYPTLPWIRQLGEEITFQTFFQSVQAETKGEDEGIWSINADTCIEHSSGRDNRM